MISDKDDDHFVPLLYLVLSCLEVTEIEEKVSGGPILFSTLSKGDAKANSDKEEETPEEKLEGIFVPAFFMITPEMSAEFFFLKIFLHSVIRKRHLLAYGSRDILR